MKNLLLWLALSFVVFAHGQQLDRIEYFINTDPGLGAGTEVSFSSGSLDNVTFSVDVSGLPRGINSLFVRTKNEDGVWSMLTHRLFFVSVNQTGEDPGDLAFAEFFIDDDPGYTNGTPLPGANGGDATITQLIDVSTLKPGLHQLFVRARNSTGHWSLVSHKIFMVNPPTITPGLISRIEYFVDNDPGTGSGVNISFSGTTDITVSPSIDINTLSLGTHTLNVRARDNHGAWSYRESATFFVCAENFELDVAGETEVCAGSAVSVALSYPLPNDATITWYKNGESVGTQPTFTAESFGKFSAEIVVDGCTSLSDTVRVIEIPVVAVDAGTDFSVEIGSGPKTLVGFPAEGTWSSTTSGIIGGASSDEFLPNIAGVGTFELIYTYTSESTGCSNTDGVNATVIKNLQTITWEDELGTKGVGDSDFALAATASSGLAVSFTSSNPAVATISGTTVSIVGTGTTTIKAVQAGNATFGAAEDISKELVVVDDGLQEQTIIFSLGGDANKIFGDPPFDLSATGGASGNAVYFSSSDETVAQISNTTVTIVGAGAVTITAHQEGSDEFLAADNVDQVLTIAKADQSITFDALDQKEIGSDGPFSLGAFSSSGLAIEYTSSNNEVATVANGICTFTAQGQTTITAMQQGDNNYNPAQEVSQLLIVVDGDGGGGGGGSDPQPQAILFFLGEDATKTYGDDPFQLFALGGGSGNPVTFVSENTSVATIDGTTVTIVGAGITTIIASQAGNEEYFPASDESQTLVVNKSGQTIQFDGVSSKTLGDAAVSLNAIASSELAVSFSTSSDKVALNSNVATLVKAGRVAISASQEGDDNFLPAESVEQSFCINPPKPLISMTGANTETPVLTSSVAAGNQWFMNGTTINNATGITLTISAEGTYTVQATVDDCPSVVSNGFDVIVTGVGRAQGETVRVYPNPVADFLYIDGINSNRKWELSDIMDRQVNVPVETYDDTRRADIRGLAPGMYLLRITDGSNVQLVKIIKQ